jgi:hypothetical protein
LSVSSFSVADFCRSRRPEPVPGVNFIFAAVKLKFKRSTNSEVIRNSAGPPRVTMIKSHKFSTFLMCRKNIDKKVIGEAKHPDKRWRVRTVFHAWSLDLPSTELLMLSRDISVCSRGSEAFCELSENRSATFFES